MLADGLADEGKLAFLLDRLDEAEIGGPAADVHDQALSTGLDKGRFLRGMGGQPAVERGLGFFEKRQIFQAGLPGRIHSQGASHVVKGGGHRQHHGLLFEAVGGVFFRHHMIPGLHQVP